MGRQSEISVFLPFLNKGCTSEYFNQSGNIPDGNTLLIIYVNGDSIKGALGFKILSDISSHPCECFIALMTFSTCLGHFYAHHQELQTICVLLPPMVCSAWLLVVGGQVQGSRLCVQEEGYCTMSRATSLFVNAQPA